MHAGLYQFGCLRFGHSIIPGGNVVVNHETDGKGNETSDQMEDMVCRIDMGQSQEQACVMSIGSRREVQCGNETEKPQQRIEDAEGLVESTRISSESRSDPKQTSDQVDDIVNHIDIEEAKEGLHPGAVLRWDEEADNADERKDDANDERENAIG